MTQKCNSSQNHNVKHFAFIYEIFYSVMRIFKQVDFFLQFVYHNGLWKKPEWTKSITFESVLNFLLIAGENIV